MVYKKMILYLDQYRPQRKIQILRLKRKELLHHRTVLLVQLRRHREEIEFIEKEIQRLNAKLE